MGAGPNTLLLLHGFGTNRKSWYDVAPTLAKSSTVYLFDLIGTGNSPAPADWPYTMEAQTEMMYVFIRDNDLANIVLIGHSYGGGVCLLLLQKLLENGYDELVKKLILIAPAAYPQPLPFYIALPRIPLIGRTILQFLSAELQLKIAFNIVLKNRKVITKERIKRYSDNIRQPRYRKALIKTALNVLPQGIERVIEKIEKIRLSTLLIYGKNDSVILRKNLERLSSRLPNIVTKKIMYCGHVPHEEHPQLVADMISAFLCE
ncbi:MAG: alpha/beta hydrolase [Candidatus Electrothrix sp. GW3-4]|uniref:alpha/beta fold hydrolase n=1 Tax=Candidatus Electrothrix sp. GW3-4 TaxID=3126740 RepID=UPI0030D41574